MEKYNIFEILGVIRREKYHSKFLADLLNPHGHHGLKDQFLKNFINKLKINIKLNEQTNVRVETEYNIGSVILNGKESKGGILDILLQINDEIIILENKIDTKTHDYQLTRYYNWGRSLEESQLVSKFHLIYLTRSGEKSEEDDKIWEDNTDGKFDYKTMSYSDIGDLIGQIHDSETLNCDYFNETMNCYKEIVKKLSNDNYDSEEYQQEFFNEPMNKLWEEKFIPTLNERLQTIDKDVKAELNNKKIISGKSLEIRLEGWNQDFSIRVEKWGTPYNGNEYDIIGIHSTKETQTSRCPLLKSLRNVKFNCNAGWSLERSQWYPFGFIEDRTCAMLASSFILDQNQRLSLVESIFKVVKCIKEEVESTCKLRKIIME